jgi:hypothetical protein
MLENNQCSFKDYGTTHPTFIHIKSMILERLAELKGTTQENTFFLGSEPVAHSGLFLGNQTKRQCVITHPPACLKVKCKY